MKLVKSLASDVLVIAGFAAMTYGVGCYSRPAAFIFGGLALLIGGAFIGYDPVTRRRRS